MELCATLTEILQLSSSWVTLSTLGWFGNFHRLGWLALAKFSTLGWVWQLRRLGWFCLGDFVSHWYWVTFATLWVIWQLSLVDFLSLWYHLVTSHNFDADSIQTGCRLDWRLLTQFPTRLTSQFHIVGTWILLFIQFYNLVGVTWYKFRTVVIWILVRLWVQCRSWSCFSYKLQPGWCHLVQIAVVIWVQYSRLQLFRAGLGL